MEYPSVCDAYRSKTSSLCLSSLLSVFKAITLTLAFSLHKNEFSIKHFFSKCDQLRSFLRIWSHLLKKSLMKNFILEQYFLCTCGYLSFCWCSHWGLFYPHWNHQHFHTGDFGCSLTGEICSLTFVTLVWVILIIFVRSLDLYFLLSSYFFLYLAKNQSKKHENLKKKKTEKINIFVRLNIFFVFLYVSRFVNGWGIFQSQWVWAAVKPLILESCGRTVLLYLLISLQRFEIVVLRSSLALMSFWTTFWERNFYCVN